MKAVGEVMSIGKNYKEAFKRQFGPLSADAVGLVLPRTSMNSALRSS